MDWDQQDGTCTTTQALSFGDTTQLLLVLNSPHLLLTGKLKAVPDSLSLSKPTFVVKKIWFPRSQTFLNWSAFLIFPITVDSQRTMYWSPVATAPQPWQSVLLVQCELKQLPDDAWRFIQNTQIQRCYHWRIERDHQEPWRHLQTQSLLEMTVHIRIPQTQWPRERSFWVNSSQLSLTWSSPPGARLQPAQARSLWKRPRDSEQDRKPHVCLFSKDWETALGCQHRFSTRTRVRVGGLTAITTVVNKSIVQTHIWKVKLERGCNY